MRRTSLIETWLKAATALLFAAAVLCGARAWAQEATTGKDVLNRNSYWRQYYALKGPVVRKDGGLQKIKIIQANVEAAHWLSFDTAMPTKGWQETGFDDGTWTRKPVADPDSPWFGVMCLRGRFQVDDPARVKGLSLSLKYRGGVIVYVNGKEVARKDLAANAGAEDLATDYTVEDYAKEREFTAAIPAENLRKGINVLALEVHRSTQIESLIKMVNYSIVIPRGTCGIVDVHLTAGTDDAITPNVKRPAGVQVWNSDVLNTDFEIDYGDPNESLRAIRIVVPRNGVGSGKVVVGSTAAIRGLTGTMTDLVTRDGKGRIPASMVAVRYAELVLGHSNGESALNAPVLLRGDTLCESPIDEVAVSWPNMIVQPVRGAVEPVWVTVRVPAQTKPGEYSGKLTLKTGAEEVAQVPVQVTVCRWTAPEPRNFVTFVDVVESPESVALRYDLPYWSDQHFKLMSRSLSLLGELGSRVAYIPLICDTNMGNEETMVRWTKQPDGSYKQDYSVMEKYLDILEKHQGKPEVVVFYVWDTYLEGGLTGGFLDERATATTEGRAEHQKKGPIVSMLDPATGKVEKGVLPMYSDPASVGVWGPVMKELKERMKKRGLEQAMVLGIVTDQRPSPGVDKLFQQVSPGTEWAQAAHEYLRSNKDRAEHKSGEFNIKYSATPYLLEKDFAEDPSISRMHGWNEVPLMPLFPRATHNDGVVQTQWRMMSEMATAGAYRGIARIGGDFFPALKNAKGQFVGTISARFPKTWWRMLNLESSILAAGVKEPLVTVRYEMMREGLLENEARISIDKALLDPVKRAKLGPELAQLAQDVLDERVRDMRRATGTLFAYNGGSAQIFGSAWGAGGCWYAFPATLGAFWYECTDWQKTKQEKLYETAAEVEAKLKP